MIKPTTSTTEQISLDELARMCQNMHELPQDELLLLNARLVAQLPQDTQETFKRLEGEAGARPPRPWLAEITSDSLKAFDGDELDAAVYEYVGVRISRAPDRAAALQMLPCGLQVFYLSMLIESEVMNGGLKQFFWNSPIQVVELMVPAMRELLADEAAALFEAASSVATDEIDFRMTLKRAGQFDSFSRYAAETKLTMFDVLFCAMVEKFQELRGAYIRTHEDLFLDPQSKGAPRVYKIQA